jgi:hypothetical protein
MFICVFIRIFYYVINDIILFVCLFVCLYMILMLFVLPSHFLNTSNNHPILGIVRDESSFSNPVSALLNNDCITKCHSSFSIL